MVLNGESELPPCVSNHDGRRNTKNNGGKDVGESLTLYLTQEAAGGLAAGILGTGD